MSQTPDEPRELNLVNFDDEQAYEADFRPKDPDAVVVPSVPKDESATQPVTAVVAEASQPSSDPTPSPTSTPPTTPSVPLVPSVPVAAAVKSQSDKGSSAQD